MSRWACVKLIFVTFILLFLSEKNRDGILRDVMARVKRELKPKL